MNYLLLTFDQWENHCEAINQFIRSHGEARITHRAIQWLNQLTTYQINNPGTAIIVAVENKKLYGVIAVSNYGISESIIVVHRDRREEKIGVYLINHLLTIIDKLYGRVSLDNIPSLKLCFSMGMVGFKLIDGPTGKPTMWLGIGDWKKEDVL